MAGASHPGTPGIQMGKTKHISYGITAALADVSDLWKETISEDGTQYLVDGNWRDLEIEHQEIKIKGQDSKKIQVKWTHRGPLYNTNQLLSASVLFGGELPTPKEEYNLSLAWGGHRKGEDIVWATYHIS
jgi:acyl-homoserine lactone acylase PvdQ